MAVCQYSLTVFSTLSDYFVHRSQFYIINIFCSLVHPLITPPYELIMTEFSKHKGDNWFSPPFYSGPREYKMCFCVHHTRVSLLTEVTSVCVYLMRGEYDDMLVWPFHGDITVQVVDQSSNQNHQECTLKFDDKCSISSCIRVTSGERATSGGMRHSFVLVDFKNAMYIKGDCVKFRVTKVSVTS